MFKQHNNQSIQEMFKQNNNQSIQEMFKNPFNEIDNTILRDIETDGFFYCFFIL